MARARCPRAIGRVIAAAAAALLTGACVVSPATLDGPIAVPLTVTPSATTIGVDAPTWVAPESRVYLCPSEPPALPDPGPARIGWEPDGDCHAYGSVDSTTGLEIELPLDELGTDPNSPFAMAEDWYLFILDVRDDRVVSAIRSRFGRPDGFPT